MKFPQCNENKLLFVKDLFFLKLSLNFKVNLCFFYKCYKENVASI